MTQTHAPAPLDDDEIDLRQLVTVLWRQKVLIAAIGVLGGALGLGASILSTKYVTESVLLTPGISAGNYKRYQGMLTTGARLRQYLHNSGRLTTPEGQLLDALAEIPGELTEIIKPEFAFTDRDSKAFGIKINPDDPGEMIGIHLSVAHTEPTDGKPVTLLAEYVRDTIIRVNSEGMMLDRCANLRAREQELRNEQIANEFAITQIDKRVDNLRDIIARNPDANAIDSRQIVSLEKGTERFLSPAAQLVAAEIQIADMKLAEVRRERDRVASAIKRDYYCQAQQALQESSSGVAFLEELKNIQTAVFQEYDKSIDIVEQTWNELDLERETWTTTYLQSMRFAAPPEGTETKVSKPRKAIGLALGGILGGMLGMFIALIRAWWKNEDDAPNTTTS